MRKGTSRQFRRVNKYGNFVEVVGTVHRLSQRSFSWRTERRMRRNLYGKCTTENAAKLALFYASINSSD